MPILAILAILAILVRALLTRMNAAARMLLPEQNAFENAENEFWQTRDFSSLLFSSRVQKCRRTKRYCSNVSVGERIYISLLLILVIRFVSRVLNRVRSHRGFRKNIHEK